jgi:hypothetical protein
MSRAADGRLVLAIDVSRWLRTDAPTAPTSADRLFCHIYGRSGRSSDQFIPGWPYSLIAALESGRAAWCQLLDAVRLGPEDDVAEVTAPDVARLSIAGIDGTAGRAGRAYAIVADDMSRQAQAGLAGRVAARSPGLP